MLKPSTSGKNLALHSQLGSDNKRCMGVKYNTGIPSGPDSPTFQTIPPKELSFNKGEMDALSTEVGKMLESNAIRAVQRYSHSFYSQLLVVPRKGEGLRPIINLKKLNRFVYPQHFKIESITMLKDILRKGDYMTKVDQKDAY